LSSSGTCSVSICAQCHASESSIPLRLPYIKALKGYQVEPPPATIKLDFAQSFFSSAQCLATSCFTIIYSPFCDGFDNGRILKYPSPLLPFTLVNLVFLICCDCSFPPPCLDNVIAFFRRCGAIWPFFILFLFPKLNDSKSSVRLF